MQEDLEAGVWKPGTAELVEMASYYGVGDFAPATQQSHKPLWLQAYLDKPNDREPIDWQGYDE